jgi:hypothetical protein
MIEGLGVRKGVSVCLKGSFCIYIQYPLASIAYEGGLAFSLESVARDHSIVNMKPF